MDKDRLTQNLLAEERPEVIENLHNGQGTVHYNHNIKEVLVKESEGGSLEIVETEAEATGKRFQYDCLRVEYPTTRNNILATLLNAKYDRNQEDKMRNDYEAAKLGILEESAKQPYIDFLNERKALKEQVDADCEPLNIPNSL